MRASISRTELFAFVRQLGGNPNDTRHIEITPDCIKVTTFLRDEQGQKFLDGIDPATKVTTIAIVGGGGDSDTVRMRHPNLDAEVDVPASAVGHHAVAGWEAVAPSAPPAAPKDDPPEQSAPETKSETPRGRRKAKEE